MKIAKKILPVILILIYNLSISCVKAEEKTDNSIAQTHQSTNWQIQPSFKYDVLTLLNTLTGDSYYLHYYQKEFDHFNPMLTTEVRDAFANLKKIIKDDGGGIISAYLSLYFSASDDETLDDMIGTLHNSDQMRENLRATTYYSEEEWVKFESIKSDLKTIFLFLKDIEFPSYWQETIQPKVLAKVEEIEPKLPGYNVIGEVETLIGYPLPTDTITVYLLYFSQPHGIRITGTRFLTDVAWPFTIVVSNAIHEMMHPPYDTAGESELKDVITMLKNDSFLMNKVENHNPSFGYNTLEGFVEEDVVQALDQIISERLGVSKDVRHRWKMSDDGMHVFAVALYNVMKEENFAESGEALNSFLIRQIKNGKLKPGNLKTNYDEFYEKCR